MLVLTLCTVGEGHWVISDLKVLNVLVSVKIVMNVLFSFILKGFFMYEQQIVSLRRQRTLLMTQWSWFRNWGWKEREAWIAQLFMGKNAACCLHLVNMMRYINYLLIKDTWKMIREAHVVIKLIETVLRVCTLGHLQNSPVYHQCTHWFFPAHCRFFHFWNKVKVWLTKPRIVYYRKRNMKNYFNNFR